MTQASTYRFRRRAPALLALGFAAGLFIGRGKGRGRDEQYARHHSGEIIFNASEAIISTDQDNNIVLANPSAAAMFRTSAAAMRGRPLSDFINPVPSAADGAPASFGDAGGRAGRRAT
ncbi:MAG: PAS domain-containing protein, partial [Massilia sp.]